MGRNQKRWKDKRRNRKRNRDDGHNNNNLKKTHGGGGKDNGDDYCKTVVDRGNFKMEVYYAIQGLYDHRFVEGNDEIVKCQTEEEKQEERMKWRTASGKILPASFRIAEDVPCQLRECMETELQELLKAMQKEAAGASGSTEKKQEEMIRKLEFLPHAYQLRYDRSTIRKDTKMKDLHEWLKRHTTAGSISRQETVSMIPPAVLDVQPHHAVLDMCAAPGSKTAQLLEALDWQQPTAHLVANDSNPQRAYMLVHQLRRILHHNPVAIITACHAQRFPAVIQFDRILADVPCTGDGTMRKNINVWNVWNCMAALSLHPLQLEIAWKGCSELLRVGGLICYSTCSQNPVENEAVVAELLRRGEGSLELVDVRSILKGFKSRPGWSTWKVYCEDKSSKQKKDAANKNNAKMQEKRKEWKEKNMGADHESSSAKDSTVEEKDGVKGETPAADETEEDGTNKAVSNGESASTEQDDVNKKSKKDFMNERIKFEPTSMDEVTLMEMAETVAGLRFMPKFEDVPGHLQKRVRATVFPPTEKEAAKFHLERCIRCLPHDMDTGGFFVSILRKVAPLSKKDVPVEKGRKQQVSVDDDKQEEKGGPDVKRARIDEPSGEEGNGEAVQQKEDDGDNAKGADKAETKCKNYAPAKANFVRGKDGKRHPELGKDDFVPVSDDILKPLVEFYGLSASPTFRKDLYMTRAEGDVKIIYYISPAIKDLIDLGFQKRITVVNSGLKGFVRNKRETEKSDTCQYRVAQEGVHFLAPHMTKRKIIVQYDDFIKCLTVTQPAKEAGEERSKSRSLALSTFSDDFVNEVKPLPIGSFVVALKGYEDQYHHKLFLTMWRCRGDNIDTLVAKADIEAMTDKLEAMVGLPIAKSPIQKAETTADTS